MKKCLIVQIDSVPLDVINIAMKKGYLPFIKSLVDRGYNLQEMFCGLPSTTPASQVNLFYGLSLLPGFRFVDKKTKKVFSAEYPDMVVWLENTTFLKNSKGLLRNGLGVLSIFSGGSMKSVSADMVKKNRLIIFRYLPFLLNPFSIILRLLRILLLFLVERTENIKSHHSRTNSQYVIKRILHEVLFSELGFYTVKKAIVSNDKVIYINFSGYDEISHHYGGYSNFALYYLSIVDIYIKLLQKEIENKNPEREIIVISDHGQTPSIPVITYSGQSIGDKIASFFPDKRIVEHKIDYYSKYTSKSDLYLLNSGGFCQGYDMNSAVQLNENELEDKYPEIFNKISNIDAVEFVLVRQDKLKVIKKGKKYDLVLENGKLLLPFFDEKDRSKVIEGLIKVMSGPFAPDFCAIAKIIDINKVVVFEDQLSAHGGIGGYQTQSFILSKNRIVTPDNNTLIGLHDVLERLIYSN